VICAAVGLYHSLRSKPEDDPIYTALPLASSFAAFIAAHSIVAALIARQRAGRGQRLEVPLFDAAFQAIGGFGERLVGKPPQGLPITFNLAAVSRYQCADGRWIDLSPPLRGFRWFAERFVPKEFNDAGVTNIARPEPERVTQLGGLLAQVFKTRTAAEWERVVNEEAGSAIAVCQTTAEWLHDEHARASGCVISLLDSELGPTSQAGYAVSLSKTPPKAKGPRHPLDADRQAVLSELTTQPTDAHIFPDSGTTPLSRALEGFRAIDTSQILAGPTACRILAEYGAEVIKINNPNAEHNPLATLSHRYVNNGKRTMLLDLKSSEGHEILWGLVEKADVFHHNFVGDAAKRMGIGEADIRERRPAIIYSAVSCHSDGGFRGGYRGHEELGQAVTGIELRCGGDAGPARAGWALCDYSTGHLSAFAILLGLFHRLRTGEGQHVHASLSRSGTFLQIPFMVDYEGRRWDEPRGQQAKGWGPLYRLYKASDRWFFLAASRPDDSVRLATVAGLDGVDEVPQDQLESELTARFAGEQGAVWVSRLVAAGLSAHLFRTVHENLDDPSAERRGLSILREHPGVGQVRNIGSWARLSLTPLDPLFAAPPLGWHSREIVEEVGLGDRFADLVASGVVAGPRENTAGT
jgi:crotonobetainyl-CoA:carnitine CoA-transferase CaiB-like acyl-CoA transferase